MSQMSTALGDADFGPLVLSPRKTATALDCSITKVYELINAGEVESFLDGHARKITVESIRSYIARRLGDVPAKLQSKIAAATESSLATRRARRAVPASA